MSAEVDEQNEPLQIYVCGSAYAELAGLAIQ